MSFRLSATKTPENADENEAFENGFESGKRSFSSVDNRNRRILKAVSKWDSYPFVSISAFGRFSVNDSRKHIKKCVFCWQVKNNRKRIRLKTH